MRKVRGQLILIFFVMQFLATILATGLSLLISNSQVGRDVGDSLYSQRIVALDLAKKSQLSAEEIANVLSTSSVSLRVANEREIEALGETRLRQIMDGTSMSLGNNHRQKAYFLLAGEVAVVESGFGDEQFTTANVRSGLNNMFMGVIAILAMMMVSGRMVRPIVELNRATRQVAAGNFDVQVRTDLKLLHLPQANELTELTQNFNHMTNELKGIEYLRRDFTSSVSHELKTPIASISGYARLLQDEQLEPEDRREYACAILSEARRLANLSDNLLRLTRLESQQIRPAAKQFDLSEQLRQAVTSIYPELERKRISVYVELADARITADEELVSQVWSNLLGNALKFTPEDGRIDVRLEVLSDHVEVRIADSGMGMDEGTLKRMYEKFYQADGSRHTGGSGLGLSLVKRIVDICGGTIEAQSSLGNGAAFTVRLPKACPRY